jgi:hypothetical protein
VLYLEHVRGVCGHSVPWLTPWAKECRPPRRASDKADALRLKPIGAYPAPYGTGLSLATAVPSRPAGEATLHSKWDTTNVTAPCLLLLAWPLSLWYADAEFLSLCECRQNVIVFTLEMRANTYEYERHK